MSLLGILLILLILGAFGGGHYYGAGYGYGAYAPGGFLIVLLIVLLVMGRL